MRTIGVLNLIGYRGGSAISGVGETRLLTTLARQIGSAVQNMRLFEEILTRERLIGELELAHDLQMGLLPDLREFHEIADASARCLPAKTVGGDFYQLFKLPEGQIGTMIGDITSHGFGASLIMALSMSAIGIYAAETTSPAALLKAIHRALIQQLESTETFLTIFYGVINPAQKVLCYANAGHAHAFRLHADDPPQRLGATSAPLGVAEYDAYSEAIVPWESEDLLCLFTDGLTTPAFLSTEGALIDAVSDVRHQSAAEIIDIMFEVRRAQGVEAPDDQTALVLRIENSK
jgi:sigma-B regulation protein RsbU (phosphoserine phosphatase)